MNSDKDDKERSKEREAKAKAGRPEHFEPETKPSQEPAEPRESPEGGYGWGV